MRAAGEGRPGERRWVAFATTVILVFFAGQLALAGWNRSGETARLELSDASLELPWVGPRNEGRALSLSLDVEPRTVAPAELARLGFPMEWMERERERRSGDGRPPRSPLPRSAWLVIDRSPEAWRDHLARRQRELDERVAAGELEGSLLDAEREALAVLRRGPRKAVISAVGEDSSELRRRYPDPRRQAVVPGEVRVWHAWRGHRWRAEAVPSQTSLNVPPRLHRRVRRLADEEERRQKDLVDEAPNEPPFRAVVVWGRRHEPWLVDFSPAAEGAAGGQAPSKRGRGSPESR